MQTSDLLEQKNDERIGQYIEEYKILRGEMMHYMEKDDAMCRQMYAVVAAILSVAFAAKISNVCLAAFCVIIPVSYKLVYSKERMAKLSAYMRCFLEEQIPGFCWESRVCNLRRKKKEHSRSWLRLHNTECIAMALLCSLMYLYLYVFEEHGGRIGWNDFRNVNTLTQVLTPIMFCFWVSLITQKRDRFLDLQKDWESKWENLKKEEIENERHKGHEFEGVQQGAADGGIEKGRKEYLHDRDGFL